MDVGGGGGKGREIEKRLSKACDLTTILSSFPTLQKLVAKPDQLIKRRGKLGLIKVKADFEEAGGWIKERIGKDQQVKFK